MKLANALPTLLTALGLLWANVSSAAQMARFVSVKGKVRIEGTSNIDSWQIECKTVEGFLEAHSDFPLRTGQKNTPGPVDAHGEFFLEARALKSVERDGKPFSNKMDEIMYDTLRAREHPKILFHLSRLALKTAARSGNAPSELEVHGELVVAGSRAEISFPLKVLPLERGDLRLWSSTTLKMSDFRMDPPAPKIALGLIKTGDEVRVSFEWELRRQR